MLGIKIAAWASHSPKTLFRLLFKLSESLCSIQKGNRCDLHEKLFIITHRDLLFEYISTCLVTR